jgi:hypothetical protein
MSQFSAGRPLQRSDSRRNRGTELGNKFATATVRLSDETSLTSQEGQLAMGSGRRRRVRSKSRHRAAGKRQKTPRRAGQVETTHSLLLASLKFWEIERDLIEERIAAIGR